MWGYNASQTSKQKAGQFFNYCVLVIVSQVIGDKENLPKLYKRPHQ